ncbi:MAG: 50S ribosomal protein L16 [Planctomycetes bacterium]|nr:50S ribosomal protein L16 [Planctomycetota bacterium]
MFKLPKRVKYRKLHRGNNRRAATRGNFVAFGEFGLQALENCWITARQLEAGRVAASHFLAGTGRLYVRVFPHRSVTGRPPETRMGKGKGEPEYWCATVKAGHMLYEVGGVPRDVARECLNRVTHKLPCGVRFVARRISV